MKKREQKEITGTQRRERGRSEDAQIQSYFPSMKRGQWEVCHSVAIKRTKHGRGA